MQWIVYHGGDIYLTGSQNNNFVGTDHADSVNNVNDVDNSNAQVDTQTRLDNHIDYVIADYEVDNNMVRSTSQYSYHNELAKMIHKYGKTCKVKFQPDDCRLSHYDVIIPTNKGNLIIHTFAYSDSSNNISDLDVYYENDDIVLFEIDFSKFYNHRDLYSAFSVGHDQLKSTVQIDEFYETLNDCEQALINLGIFLY